MLGKLMLSSQNPKIFTGEQAIAEAAIYSGIKMVAGYPGSPGGGVLSSIVEKAKYNDIRIEWSTNEKVAAEMAIGASIAGYRTMVCVKNVGLNAMIDPLMAINLSPINAGMVFIIGDDPGGYGSQNDQDSRPMALQLEMPWLEPSNPRQAFDLTVQAFEWSEKFKIPLFLRITRGFSVMTEKLVIPKVKDKRDTKDVEIFVEQFVAHPGNAVAKHKELRERLMNIANSIEQSGLDVEIGKSGETGIIACGHINSKLDDVLKNGPGQIPILRLVSIYPLPDSKVEIFLAGKKHVIILEEHHPVVGNEVKRIAADCHMQIHFSQINEPGELFRWKIAELLRDKLSDLVIAEKYSAENEKEEIHALKSNCDDCRYDQVLDILDEAADREGVQLIYIGDPGCLVTVTDRLDAKMAMGGAVAIATGYSQFEKDKLVVAIFGDSSFFHSTLPAICNAHYQNSNILLVLLDNGTALTTGAQSHPGSGKDIFGKEKPALSYENIARACGVQNVWSMSIDNPEIENLAEAIRFQGLRLVIIKIPVDY